ncbi:MAG: hypothetical protein GYB65_16705 [Chloroflexi bacterium]|nr:hypothetical protein [Chloroflexota bacterium]
MNALDSFELATDQLDSLSPDITLLILHPDFHGQHRLFAPLLRDSDKTSLFLAIPEQDLSFAALLSELEETLETQLDPDVPELPDAPEAAAQSLAANLQAHGPANLIIDNFDLVQQEAVAPFITALAHHLSPGSRLALGTRELPMTLLSDDSLREKMALIPVNADKMMLDYVASADQNVLEVRALGPGRVLINGRLVEHWDGVLPRTLFFYFVDRGMTTRDEIFQTFWPNLSTREATNVFHVTKRKISEILGVDLTVYWSGFYRISPDLELHYDVVKFAEAVQNAAVASDQDAVQMLQNAIELYHGPFLSTMEQEWVNHRRNELSMNYAEALAGLARIHENQNAKLSALGYYLRASATSPQREDLARAIMLLYRDLGKPDDAIDTYDRLTFELKRTLNVSPAPQTAEIADGIRNLL